MFVKARFKYEDKDCYLLSDGADLEIPLTMKGLYTSYTLADLQESGYKIYDYHGNIVSADGVPIKEVAEIDYYLNNDARNMMLDEDEAALSEAEATQFFTREVSRQGIDLATSTNEIKTREELIAYLNEFSRLRRAGINYDDIRPLNSFVAKDALFSLEEIASADEVLREETIRYMRVIDSRKTLPSYTAYEKLIKFLQDAGKLGQSYDYEDVRRAYLSWGICGIKDTITSSKIVDNYVQDIAMDKKKMEENANNLYAGRRSQWCLLDREGVLYSGDEEVNLMEYDNFDLAPIVPLIEGEYAKFMRTSDSWDTEYQLIQCKAPVKEMTTEFIIIDGRGVQYYGNFRHDRYAIRDAGRLVLLGENLSIKGPRGANISIKLANSRDEFKLYNLACAKAKDLIDSKTRKSPVKSSYELYLQEGVSPDSAVNAIVESASDGKNYIDAAKSYLRGPSDELVEKYNPDGLECDTVNELIEIMRDTREDMDSQGENATYYAGDAASYAASQQESKLRFELEQLETASGILSGEISVGELQRGFNMDASNDTEDIARMLLLVLDKKFPGGSNIDAKVAALSDIELTSLVDVYRAVGEHIAGWRGYLRDRARLNADRATQALWAIQVTKVFREMSNLPVSEQRHYMFMCSQISFEKGHEAMITARDNIAACIARAVDKMKDVEYEVRESLAIEAPAIAIDVIFKLGANRNYGKRTADGRYAISHIHMIENIGVYKIDFTIRAEDYLAATDLDNYQGRQLCTLFDWCYEEYSGGAWSLYCANANITPWYVTPKPGVTIPVYNFTLNYLSDQAYMQVISQGLRDKIEQQKARVCDISKICYTQMLFPGDPDWEPDVKSTPDICLDLKVDESIPNYYTRFMLHKSQAKKNNQTLLATRLKSDAIYLNYASSIGVQALEEDIYEEPYNQADDLKILTVPDVELLSGNIKERGITANGNNVTVFDPEAQTYEELASRTDIIFGDFQPATVYSIRGTQLIWLENGVTKVLDLMKMTKQEADAYVAAGNFYQLGAREYLIYTVLKKVKLSIA